MTRSVTMLVLQLLIAMILWRINTHVIDIRYSIDSSDVAPSDSKPQSGPIPAPPERATHSRIAASLATRTAKLALFWLTIIGVVFGLVFALID